MSSALSALTPIRQSRPLVILLAGVALGNLPLLAEHFFNMWKYPQYQYFPLVLVAIGWLVWNRARWRAAPVESNASPTGAVAALVMSIALAMVATVVGSPWVATLSFVVAIGGLLLLMRQWVTMENAFGTWVLLWLILRPPLSLDMKLAFWLQGVTANVAGALLDMLGTVNIVDGNTIVLPQRQLFVEEACSGIVSLMAVIAGCLLIAVFRNRPAPHAILLTASGAVWAGVLNTVRIVIIGVTLQEFDIDLTSGWRHETLGLVLFGCTVGLSVCADCLLVFLLAPVREPEQAYDPYFADQEVSILTRAWNTLVQPGRIFHRKAAAILDASKVGQIEPPFSGSRLLPVLGATFLLVGATQVVFAAIGPWKFNRVEPHAAVLALSEDSMPEKWNGMKRTSFAAPKREVGAVFGDESRQWTYKGDNVQVTASLDFVFLEFHDLAQCYTGIGWTVSDRQIVARPGTSQKFVEVQLTKGTGERAFLVYGSFDQSGNKVTPPGANLAARVSARLSAANIATPQGSYQTQLFVRASDLTESQQREFTSVFFDFYDSMASTVREAD